MARIEESDGDVLVWLCGEVDIGTVPTFHRVLGRYIAQPDRVIQVDLTSLGFIDACGVRAFLDAQTHARAWGSDVVFSNARGIVARVIRLLGLESELLMEAADE